MILNIGWSYAPTLANLISMIILTLFIESLFFYLWCKTRELKTPITLAEIIIMLIFANLLSGFLGIFYLLISIKQFQKLLKSKCEKMKKGPVCYIYYAIKNKRQLKLKEQKRIPEEKELSAQTEIYLVNQ